MLHVTIQQTGVTCNKSRFRSPFAAGLAFREMLSVSGIWGQLQFGFDQLPPRLPLEVNGRLRRSQDPKKHKNPRFSGFYGSPRMLSDQVRGESNTRRNLLKSKHHRNKRQDHTNIGTNIRPPRHARRRRLRFDWSRPLSGRRQRSPSDIRVAIARTEFRFR